MNGTPNPTHDRSAPAGSVDDSDLGDYCRLAVESAVDIAIITFDLRRRVTSWNPGAEKVFGYPANEIVGRPMDVLMTPENIARNVLERELERVQRDGRAEDDCWMVRNDGTRFFASGFMHAMRNDLGEIRGFLKILRDITHRRALQARETRMTALSALRADVGVALTQPRASASEIAQICAEAIMRHLPAAFARVWLLDAATQTLELHASAGMYTHLDGPHSRVRVGELKIGRIAKEGRPHLTNDVLHDPRISDPEWARREGLVAFAGYPLLVEGNVLGVLALFAREALPDDMLGTLAAVADIVAQSIQRKNVELALEAQNARLRRLAEFSGKLLLADDPDALVRDLFQQIANDLKLDAFFNFMVVEPNQTARLDVCGGVPDDIAARIQRIDFREAFCGGKPMQNEPIVVEHVQASDAPDIGLIKDLGIRAYVCHPLLIGSRVIGTLAFGSRQRDTFAPEDLEMIRSLAHYVSIAKERIRLDRAFQEQAQQVEEGAQRFRLIWENVKDAGIFTTDTEGRVTDWNPGAERVFGFSEGEIIGQSADVLLYTPEDQRNGVPQQERSTAIHRSRRALACPQGWQPLLRERRGSPGFERTR